MGSMNRLLLLFIIVPFVSSTKFMPEGGTCEDELGRIYDDGEAKTCPDGCNTCRCTIGGLIKTAIGCPPSAQLCKYGDQILEGDETVTCKNGRQLCTCKNGKIKKSKKILVNKSNNEIYKIVYSLG